MKPRAALERARARRARWRPTRARPRLATSFRSPGSRSPPRPLPAPWATSTAPPPPPPPPPAAATAGPAPVEGPDGRGRDDRAPAGAAAAFDPASCRSLYIGNLHPYVNEVVLHDVFSTLGPVAGEGRGGTVDPKNPDPHPNPNLNPKNPARLAEVKLIKDRATGASAGYGFIRFVDHRSAELALASVGGRLLYGQEASLFFFRALISVFVRAPRAAPTRPPPPPQVRVNWAFQKDQREDTAAHTHIFVGDLPGDASDRALFDAFAARTRGVSDARVMWDHATGRSRGFGFVSFRAHADAEAAIATMHGATLGARRVRCGWAQHKDAVPAGAGPAADPAAVHAADPAAVTVYVGGVPPDAADADVRDLFAGAGPVLDVRVHRKGGCVLGGGRGRGFFFCLFFSSPPPSPPQPTHHHPSYAFVTYARHDDAVTAIVSLHGARLAGRAVKCSWGRPAARAASAGPPPPPPARGLGPSPPLGMPGGYGAPYGAYGAPPAGGGFPGGPLAAARAAAAAARLAPPQAGSPAADGGGFYQAPQGYY